jgi:SP family facilitated glucose transporter-like MFS transporter 8
MTNKEGSYVKLFTNNIYREALFIVTMVGLAQRFGGISYMLSYGVSDLPDSRHPFNREHCFVAFSIFSLISNLCSGFLIDHIGRKPVLLFSTIVTSAGMFAGAFYFQQLHSRNDPVHYWIPYTVEIIFSIAFTAGLGVLPATFQGELFPANVKRQASAVVVMILSLGSFGVNLSHEYVVKHWGVAGNYYMAAFSSLFFTGWSYFYVFETKGKTLLEIQNKLVSRTESGIKICT